MKFDFLQTLLVYIQSSNPRFFDQYDRFFSSDKQRALIQHIQSAKVEEDLISGFYGDQRYSAYSKFKSRFTDFLLDLFIVDNISILKRFSSTTLTKYWLLTILFKSLGQLDLSHSCAKRGLRLAQKNDKFLQAFKFANYLKKFYLLVQWDAVNFKKMEVLEKKYSGLYTEEHRWTALYYSLSASFYEHREGRKSALPDFSEFDFSEEPKYLSKHNTFYFSSAKVLYLILLKDYKSALGFIEGQFLSLDSAEGENELLNHNLSILQAQIYLHLGEYEKALQKVDSKLDIFNGIDSIRLAQLLIRIYLRKGQYNEAFDLFRSYYSTAMEYELKALPIIESYHLLNGLFYWLYGIGKICDEHGFFDGFKYAKWLNSMPGYSKDKMGMNIVILMIDLLLCKMQNWASMYHRLESLDQYRYRYLRNSDLYAPYERLFKLFSQRGRNHLELFSEDDITIELARWETEKTMNTPLYWSEMELLPLKEVVRLFLKD